MRPTLGFIGQGWIGKNYADHYEERGFSVVRYSLEEEYIGNKEKIRECDIVFVAVPTPTTPRGFDDSRVREAVRLVGDGKIAVVKSTIPPGTTRSLAKEHRGVFVLHAPEFLREAFARYDVDNPERLIIGIPEESMEYREKAQKVIDLGPRANYTKIVRAEEAELIKYAHNTVGYVTVVFANILYDLARAHGVDFSGIKEAILNNPWYPSKYLDPVHKGGRGAGGDCFIKDFATFVLMYEKTHSEDREGIALLRAFEAKNNRLLRDTKKDLDLLRGVYGE